MKEFQSKFSVKASLKQVQAFHRSTAALKQLSPPPMWVQLHESQPLAEGSISRFTLWFLFIPLHWTAKHSEVSETGFTDQQISGPMKFWQHRHNFTQQTPHSILIQDHVEYQLPVGWQGWLLTVLFNPLGLRVLFWYRAMATRFFIRQMKA